MKKIIGIVGGMGPSATAELFKIIIENTKSGVDSGHIRILIDNNTQIPDRTNAILGDGESPVPEIVKSAKGLIQLGADIILIPCNTSHYFFDEIKSQCCADVINMIDVTAEYLKQNSISCVGILATSGTVMGGVYEKYLQKNNIRSLYPSVEEQEEVMNFIYDGVKAGNKKYDASKFQRIVDHLYEAGAQVLIFGCTEIVLGVNLYGVQVRDFVEPMKILSRVAIERAGYELV